MREDVVARLCFASKRRASDYGVALDPADLSIDADATAQLRRDTAGFMKLRIGIDVGGTFTDVTAFDEDAGELVAIRKYPSDPAQPAAVMEDDHCAILPREFGADAVSLILHGSTAALNTMLEGKGVARRPHHDARLSRRLRDRPAMARRRGVQHFRAGAEDAADARPHPRDRASGSMRAAR